ncbi:MAG: hypothetical protein GXO90_11635 [FCB group bacterium]|nr:hypothetical protein [FCB group bacterium]
MGKNLRNILIVLGVLILALWINRLVQHGYQSSSELAFDGKVDDIVHIRISNPSDTLDLVKAGETWSIQGADSLVIRENRITDFFDKVLKVKKETLVSRNPDKWSLYSVDDSTGVHIWLYGADNQELSHFIMGRSKSDWARNNIRLASEQEVYLTNENVLYRVNPRVSYWGEKPKPPAPPDSTATPSAAENNE